MVVHAGRSVRRRWGAFFALLALMTSVLAALAVPSSADHEPGHVLVTPLDGSHLNKCQGAMPTAGSENTDKRLVGGTLVPGGTAVFEFTYPFDPTDDSGRQDFVILDCVFIDDEPALAFELNGVPNDVSPFIFQFTVDIPADFPVGAEFCNVGKTTAAPSSAQASNRKAGPACFVIGGDLRVLKVDQAGAPLTGATFQVTCSPTTTLLAVMIEGVARTTYTGTTGTDNAITIAGPAGTPCVITETAAPGGYVLATPASVTATIGVDGPDITFVNPRATGDLAITKVSDAPGTFSFTVNCPGTGVTNQPVTVTVATAGAPGATSAPITAIPTGTVCTVTEATAAGFQPQPAQTVTIAQGTNTVTFTNVRLTGTLVVSKTTIGGAGTFSFTVDCNPGTAFDQTLSLTNTETRRITGIPTGTTCLVTEATSALFTSTVNPANGTVTIATGDNVVAFTNTARPPVLGVTKTADAATVTAGSAIGFTVAVANTGTGPATAVTLDDPLPAATGVSWTVSPAYAGPGTCAVTGAAPAQRLVCAFGDLAPAALARVHVSSSTTAATSGTLTNTATAQAANHGPVSATAAVTVNIPPVAPPQVTPPPVVLGQVTPPVVPSQVTPPPSVLGEVVTAPPVEVQGGTLPRTGLDSLTMAATGWALIGVGLVFRRLGRRRGRAAANRRG